MICQHEEEGNAVVEMEQDNGDDLRPPAKHCTLGEGKSVFGVQGILWGHLVWPWPDGWPPLM